MRWQKIFPVVLSAAVCFSICSAQESKKSLPEEQSEFNYEQEILPIRRPIPLANDALRALAGDATVASCLENEQMSSAQLPASWFVASEIHLGKPDSPDLIVLPNLDLARTHSGPSPIVCFLGANTGWFWILRRTPAGYRLIAAIGAHGIEISARRTNGLRDIIASTIQQAGASTFEVTYQFDGMKYVPKETITRH